MAATVFPAPSSGGATTPIGASSLLYSGAAPYGGTSLTGLSLAAGTYAIVLNQSNANRGLLTTANNGKFNLDGDRPTYVTLTTTETTFNISGGLSNNYANVQLGRSRINTFSANSTDTLFGMGCDTQANGTYNIRTSTNLTHWKDPGSSTSSFHNTYNTYINAQKKRLGNFIGFTRDTNGSNFIFTSDGTTWTQSSLPGNTVYGGTQAIDYNATLGRWIAKSSNSFNAALSGARIGISTNGSSWTEVSPTTLGLNSSESYVFGVALSGTATAKYVVTGTVGYTTPRIVSSTDGTTWTSRTVPTISGNVYVNDVVWSDVAGVYLASTSVANNFVISTDGITWSAQTINIVQDEIYATSTGFWMYGSTQCKNAYSTNGTTWSYIDRPETGTYFLENGFVADSYTSFYPRKDGKGADRFMSSAQDNSSVYGTNRHVLMSWEPLTYMIYSTAITTV